MKVKTCKYCNKSYPESEFGIALTTKNKIYRRNKCKHCYRATKNQLREKYRQWIINYKKKQKCSKCDIADYRVLEFHHKDKNDNNKEFTIGDAIRKGQGFNRIKKEIAKCVVICANCHRILHYKERGKNTT